MNARFAFLVGIYAFFCNIPLTYSHYAGRWFVDGQDAFEAMADALEGAKKCIFIADWFLVVETYMRRKYPPSIENRLDKILQRKASEVGYDHHI